MGDVRKKATVGMTLSKLILELKPVQPFQVGICVIRSTLTALPPAAPSGIMQLRAYTSSLPWRSNIVSWPSLCLGSAFQPNYHHRSEHLTEVHVPVQFLSLVGLGAQQTPSSAMLLSQRHTVATVTKCHSLQPFLEPRLCLGAVAWQRRKPN